MLLTLIVMCLAADSEAKVVDKGPLFVDGDYIFMTVFIREALIIEDNT